MTDNQFEFDISDVSNKSIEKLSADQIKAYNILCGYNNVFLSGRAGTGKSYLINKFIDDAVSDGKRVVVCAPTGIAALNIGGSTLHRTFRAPLGLLVDVPIKKNNILDNCDILIIDEVSMCRLDMFEFIVKTLDLTNSIRYSKGLEPVRIICVGDFFQLPPVIKDEEREVLSNYFPNFNTGFAFESNLWEECNFVPAFLTEVIRQKDEMMCKALNMIRIGNNKAVNYFNAVSNTEFIDKAVYICGTNKRVSEYNEQKFKELKGEEHLYKAKITGEVKDSDKSTNDELILKEGALVMVLTNSSDYKNGELGIVLTCKKKKVEVLMNSGVSVWIEPYTWEIYSYNVENGKAVKKVIGTFEQIPLKLGYAITIHKSQGQTYEKANLQPYCWDYGQLYVALSRVKSIQNLHLTQPIQSKYVKASQAVFNFYARISGFSQ